MPTFVMIAYDGTDTEAPQRRLNARPKHLAFMQSQKEAGIVQLAVALQNEAGTASIGSMLVLNVADESQVQAYLKEEPYVQAGVWQHITTHLGAIPPLFHH